MRWCVSSRFWARQSGVPVTRRSCSVAQGSDQAPLRSSLLAVALVAPVALPEALHPARGVQHALVAGPERVRGGGDVDDHQGVAAPVGPLDRLVAVHGRAGLVRGAARGVPEDDLAVLGVDALAHALTLRLSR